MIVKLNDTIYVGFTTANPSTGAAQTADSTPTVIVYINGTSVGYAPTVSNLATGRYQVQIDFTAGNGFADTQQVRLDVTATVAAIAGAETLGLYTVQTVLLDDVYTQGTLIQKILRNKFITDPVTGLATLYDNDGTTILMQGLLYQDAAGLTKYQGQGAERRERMV
jgi:hypothetical protein